MSESEAESARAERLEAEDNDLQEGLDGLSTLMSARLPLAELLTEVARYAVRAIPGADGAGLTLLEEDRADTIVATARFVEEIDAVQYSIGQGPCITAAATGQTVMSGALGADLRWRRFGAEVASMRVNSVVSLPLLAIDTVVGAMNVYAYAEDAFDDRAAELGQLFAGPAAIAVQNAQILAQTQRLAARLQAALDTRVVVERAVGIVMSRSGVDDVEARRRLTALSQDEHLKLVVIAQNLIDEAVRRARARTTREDVTNPR